MSSEAVARPLVEPTEPALPDEERLFAFYDRLRARVRSSLFSRSRLGKQTADVLLLAPDVFMLLVRLVVDRDVPASSRRMIAGALAYFLLPVDLLPEAFLGVGGFVDDLVLASLVLSHALGPALEPLAGRHWSGSRNLRIALRDIARAAHGLLGAGLLSRLEGLLRSLGVEPGRAFARVTVIEAPEPAEETL